MAEPRKKGLNLALIFGGKSDDKGPSKRPMSRDDSEDEDESSSRDEDGPSKDEPSKDEDDELPPGFEEAAAEAFPDLEGDHDRMLALKRLIHLCDY